MTRFYLSVIICIMTILNTKAQTIDSIYNCFPKYIKNWQYNVSRIRTCCESNSYDILLKDSSIIKGILYFPFCREKFDFDKRLPSKLDTDMQVIVSKNLSDFNLSKIYGNNALVFAIRIIWLDENIPTIFDVKIENDTAFLNSIFYDGIRYVWDNKKNQTKTIIDNRKFLWIKKKAQNVCMNNPYRLIRTDSQLLFFEYKTKDFYYFSLLDDIRFFKKENNDLYEIFKICNKISGKILPNKFYLKRQYPHCR